MIGLDTNVLVRYLTQDDPAQAHIANHFLEHVLTSKNPGYVNHVVQCELVWVLESDYDFKRAQIADTLQHLFEVDCVRLEAPAQSWRALDAYRDGADFSDALIGLCNGEQGCEYTATFDKRAARHARFRLLKR